MPCCHNQWVKPAMTDLGGEHSLNLKLQNKDLNVSEIRLSGNKSYGCRNLSLRSSEGSESIADHRPNHFSSSHTQYQGPGQELKAGTLRNAKTRTKRRTIRFLFRTVSLWSGTLHGLYQILPSHTALAMLSDTLLPLAVFLTLTFLSSLT